mmetsp:Transcript_29561/g.86234  ORF Transcript_29561/g.86234 Transcript_29561/m.86234 type:complete len:126 (-) Transcript_29561:652-1029(-)|eukprot:CAMPEP_0118961930 /NCGR_PEP_ID=MMETSP1173-20130426/450_1 /TAXON_ID=1034831 /ORGANISM="Rhizochromulina marina cf, Strain CCMP1243" /LENGTH=125 /DNA_ID=CAMNT_0006910135 /DNA_START=39 /DNA_END=416 /DNA_ORIENTATION=+
MATATVGEKRGLEEDQVDQDGTPAVASEEGAPAAKEARVEAKELVKGVKTTDGVAWELGNNRLLRVKTYRGRVLVDIREFYEDKNSGELKPGKKGISLNIENWNKLSAALGGIEQSISEASQAPN